MNQKEIYYDAFISYRHLGNGVAVVNYLQRLLETYRSPYNGKFIKKGHRISRIFTDKSEMPLNADIGLTIRDALERSRFLIVLATPEYIHSKWCMEELRYFLCLHNGSADDIVFILHGDDSDSLITKALQLCGAVDYTGYGMMPEPLYANIGKGNLRETKKLLRKEFIRVAAKLIGCGYDDLYQRHKRRKLRRSLAAAAFGTWIALTGFFGWKFNQANLQRLQNENETVIVERDTLADQKAIEQYVSTIRALIVAEDRIPAIEQVWKLWQAFGDVQAYAESIEAELSPLWIKANYAASFSILKTAKLYDDQGKAFVPYLGISSDGNYLLAITYVAGSYTEVRVYDRFLNEVMACQPEYIFAKKKLPKLIGTDNFNTTSEAVYFDYDPAAGNLLIYDMNGVHCFGADGAHLHTDTLTEEDSQRLVVNDHTINLGSEYGPGYMVSSERIYFLAAPDFLENEAQSFDSFGDATLYCVDMKLYQIQQMAEVKTLDATFSMDYLVLTPDEHYAFVIFNRGVYSSLIYVYDLTTQDHVGTFSVDGMLTMDDFYFGRYACNQQVIFRTNNCLGSFRMHDDSPCDFRTLSLSPHSTAVTEDGFCYTVDLNGNLYMIATENLSLVDYLLEQDNTELVSTDQKSNALQEEGSNLNSLRETEFKHQGLWIAAFGEYNISGSANAVIKVLDEDRTELLQFSVPFELGISYFDTTNNVFGFVNYKSGTVTKGYKLHTFHSFVELLERYYTSSQ